jgi:predicted dehydrogenase
MSKTRVAMIGAGSHSTHQHYPSLTRLDEAEIVAACDLLPERRERVAQQFGVARTYRDYREMLAKEDPEAVYVVMPPGMLYEPAATVLDQGRALFLEKPPGLTVTQTRNLARKAEAGGCLTQVGFNRRFMPQILQSVRLVYERGRIELAEVAWLKHHTPEPWDGSCDLLYGDAIHFVDLLRFLGGEAQRVAAVTRRTGGAGHPTSHTALLTFDSGMVALLKTAWTVGSRLQDLELHGPSIICRARLEHGTDVWTDGSNEPQHHPAAEEAGGDDMQRICGFFQETAHFIACVRERRPTGVELSDSVHTMELVERILREAW